MSVDGWLNSVYTFSVFLSVRRLGVLFVVLRARVWRGDSGTTLSVVSFWDECFLAVEDNISQKPNLRYPWRVRPGRSSDVELRSDPSFRDEHDLVRGTDVEPSSPSNLWRNRSGSSGQRRAETSVVRLTAKRILSSARGTVESARCCPRTDLSQRSYIRICVRFCVYFLV